MDTREETTQIVSDDIDDAGKVRCEVDDDHARIAQPFGSAGGLRIRVAEHDMYLAEAGVEQRVGARAGASMMCAWFEGDDCDSATRVRPGVREGYDLRVTTAHDLCRSLAHDRSVTHDHAADGRVRATDAGRRPP
jgi:hypothetical protein